MYCIVFSRVVYSLLKAFGKKWENKTHERISHSTVINSSTQEIFESNLKREIALSQLLCKAICLHNKIISYMYVKSFERFRSEMVAEK